MKKLTKTQFRTGISIAGAAGLLGLSGAITEGNRGKVANILDKSKSTIGEVQDSSQLSDEQKTLIVKIQTKYHILSKNIENNKRFRGFWKITKLPLYWKTSNRLEEIQKELEGEVTIGDLRKADSELKQLINDFHEIMKEDEAEVIREIQDGIAHITGKEINAIQSYMRECVEIIKSDLTIGDVSSDYTATHGSKLGNQLEKFIEEGDSDEARTMLRQLIGNYSYMSTEEDSKLALHHLTQIGERLESGDSWSELIAKISITGVSLLVLLLVSSIVIKKYALPSLGTMGKRLITGLLALLWETIEGKKKDTPPPLTDIVVEEASGNEESGLSGVIDVQGELLEDKTEGGDTGTSK